MPSLLSSGTSGGTSHIPPRPPEIAVNFRTGRPAKMKLFFPQATYPIEKSSRLLPGRHNVLPFPPPPGAPIARCTKLLGYVPF